MIDRIVNVNLLPEDKMKELGFTDRDSKHWHVSYELSNSVSFDVSIPKNGSKASVYVLDGEVGQPYPYEEILESNPTFDYALSIKQQVEDKVWSLAMAGVFMMAG